MSATIVQQVLDYYTDKTTSMAVKLARQVDEIASLKKELAWMKGQLDQVSDERDVLVRDLRLRQIEARQGRERLEEADHLLQAVEKYHDRLFAHDPETMELIINICEHLRPGSYPIEQLEQQAS